MATIGPVATKPWYESTTVWFNGLTMVAAFLGYFTQQVWVVEHPQVLLDAGFAIAAVNSLLRLFKTNSAIS
jgi:hypothetical protein